MDIIKEIFKGNYLTVIPIPHPDGSGATSAICILNYLHMKKSEISIPVEAFKILMESETIELDSGNWETGEETFVYNYDKKTKMDRKYYEILVKLLVPALREIRLNKLLNEV